MYQILWEGLILDMPHRLSSRVILSGVDIRLTPTKNIICRISLYDKNKNIILPCATCLEDKITTNISYKSMELSIKNNTVILEYDIYIICNGGKNHINNEDVSLIVNIDISQ